jgi:hypothetical protein
MGRGRAKAKQTKVARQLKYHTGGTDLSRLAEELGASSPKSVNTEPIEDDDVEDDPYARYAELYGADVDDEDEDEDDASGSHARRRA